MSTARKNDHEWRVTKAGAEIASEETTWAFFPDNVLNTRKLRWIPNPTGSLTTRRQTQQILVLPTKFDLLSQYQNCVKPLQKLLKILWDTVDGYTKTNTSKVLLNVGARIAGTAQFAFAG